MSKVERLVGRLRSDAHMESEGSFSLDRDKARAKLRQFRLPDPYRYVLLLVQAAHLLGAEEVRFDVDADDVRVAFDGAPLRQTDLDELYASLFVDADDPRVQARRKLAVALDTAASLDTQFVTLESCDRTGRGVRFTLDGDGERVESFDGGAPGTRIQVRDRWSPALVEEYFKARKGVTAEALALRQGCAMSQTHVLLNGARISHGLRLPDDAFPGIEFEVAGVRGVVGFVRPRQPATLVVLVNGVEVATRESLGTALPSVMAVVDGATLRTDLSLEKVARDDTFAAVTREIRRHVDAALARAVTAAGGWADAPGFPDWMASTVRKVLAERMSSTRKSGLDPLTLLDPREADFEVDRGLLDARVWPGADGMVSGREVFESGAETGYVTDVRRAEPVPEGFGPVLVASTRVTAQRVEAVFDQRGLDITAPLETARKIARNRAAWRARPMAPRLEGRPTVGRVRIENAAPAYVGELGAVTTSSRSTLMCIVDGCLLVELRGNAASVPGMVAVVEAPFKVGKLFDTVGHDRTLLDVLRACVVAYRRAWTDAANRAVRHADGALDEDERVPFLRALAELRDPEFPTRLLAGFGFERRIAASFVDDMDWRPLDLRGDDVEAKTWRALAPVRTTAGAPCTVGELVDRTGVIAFLAHAVDAPLDMRDPDDHPVLVLDDFELSGLVADVSGNELEDFADAYVAVLRRQQFLGRRLEDNDLTGLSGLTGQPIAQTAVRVKGLGGLVAVHHRKRATVRALVADAAGAAGRFLSSLELELDQPLVAAVSGPLVIPDAAFEGLDPSAHEAFHTGLARLWASMMRDHLRGEGGGPSPTLAREPALRALALRWLRDLYCDAAVWRAYLAEREAHGAGHAARSLASWIRPGRDPRVAAISVLEQRGSSVEGEPPIDWSTRPAVGAGRRVEPGLESALMQEVAGLAELLAAAPLFDDVEGRRVSALDVEAHRATGSPIPVALADAVRSGPRWRLPFVVVDDDAGDTLETLRCLFGGELDDAERLERELRTEARFAATQRRPHDPYDDSAILARSRVDVDDMEGELVIPRSSCAEVGRATVAVTWDDRPLAPLEVDCPLPLRARLDLRALDSELRESAAGALSLSSGDEARVRRIVRKRVSTLVNTLMSRWAQLDDEERALASGWLLAFMADRISGSDGKDVKGKLVRRVFRTPMLAAADGGWISLEQLARDGRADDGAVCVREHRWTASSGPERPVALVSDPATRRRLERIFRGTTAYDGVWARVQLAEARRRAAPPLPRQAPADAAAYLKVRGSGLKGWLWIDPSQRAHGIGIGAEGREVARVHNLHESPEEPDFFGVNGAIWGPAVEVVDEFGGVRLGGRQWSLLREQAAQCWVVLAEQVGEARGGPREVPGMTRLQTLFLELCGRRGRPGGLDTDARRIYDVARHLPLLELAGGELVSLEWAVRERPRELEYLGLWKPSAPKARSGRRRLDSSDVPSGRDDDDDDDGRRVRRDPASSMPQMRVLDDREERDHARLGGSEQARELGRAVAQLLERVRAELRMVRGPHERLLSDAALEHVRFALAPPEGRQGESIVVFDELGAPVVVATHPVVRWAAEHGESTPTAVSLVTSAVYTALRAAVPEIGPAEAFDFHSLHAQLVLTRLR